MTESKPAVAEEIPVQTEAPKRPRTAAAEKAPQPSVARVVHYQEGENPPLAALITEVSEETGVSLVIFRTHLQMFRQSVPFSEKPKPGHWNWPPRA